MFEPQELENLQEEQRACLDIVPAPKLVLKSFFGGVYKVFNAIKMKYSGGQVKQAQCLKQTQHMDTLLYLYFHFILSGTEWTR